MPTKTQVEQVSTILNNQIKWTRKIARFVFITFIFLNILIVISLFIEHENISEVLLVSLYFLFYLLIWAIIPAWILLLFAIGYLKGKQIEWRPFLKKETRLGKWAILSFIVGLGLSNLIFGIKDI